jgi:hypothetical protein
MARSICKLRRLAKAHMDSTEYEKMLNAELIMERKSQQNVATKT